MKIRFYFSIIFLGKNSIDLFTNFYFHNTRQSDNRLWKKDGRTE